MRTATYMQELENYCNFRQRNEILIMSGSKKLNSV